MKEQDECLEEDTLLEQVEQENEESGEGELSSIEIELNQTKQQMLRLIAEFDNYKKRTQKEQINSYEKGVASGVKEFLDVFDNLERATQVKDSVKEDLEKGLVLILNQYNSSLEKLNIEIIDPINQPFNPNLHNAVMHIEDENFGKETVCEVFQKGYKIGDTILRFAMVKVAN